jgi:hypothetical protein
MPKEIDMVAITHIGAKSVNPFRSFEALVRVALSASANFSFLLSKTAPTPLTTLLICLRNL